MLKLVAKLAIIAAIAHAGIKIVPVFWQYMQFKDKLSETARYGGKKSIAEVTDKANKVAADLQVPLESGVQITRNADFTIVDTTYVGQLEYLPKQFYPWKFVIHLEEVPQRYDAYMP
jgi:hypothetical protein